MALDENGLEIPEEPGRRALDGTYWCNCQRVCQGIMQCVPQRRYYDHSKHRSSGARPARSTRGVEHRNQQAEVNPNIHQVPQEYHRGDGLGGDGIGGDMGMPEVPEGIPAPVEDTPSIPAPATGNPPPPPVQAPPEPDDSGPTVASLADLQLALDFIDALKNSKLEDSGLGSAVLKRLREPLSGYLELGDDPDLRLSIKLYLGTGRASEAVYTAAREAIMEWAETGEAKSCQILTYTQVQAKIQELTGIVPLIHDMCVESCQAYTGPLCNDERCRECNEPRWEERNGKLVPRQTFFTIPIGPSLQAQWASVENALLMEYMDKGIEKLFEAFRATQPPPVPGAPPEPPKIPQGHDLEDFIHGSLFLQAVVDGKIRPGDTVLILSADGAQLYEHKASDCWIYIWVIMNLPPNARYKKRYVIPGGFIPGPNNPKNLDSFFFPGLSHLVALQKDGLALWHPIQNRMFHSNLFLLHETADGPALCYFSGLTGHNGCLGCRGFCPIHGRRYQNSHYYPALLKPDDPVPKGSDHPDVVLADLINADRTELYNTRLRFLIESENMNQYKIRRRDTGISKPSLASGISPNHRLAIPALFPSDTMHLTGLLVTEHMVNLFRGTIDCNKNDDKSTWDWVILTGDFWTEHGETVESFRRFLPGSFDRPPRDPAKKINSGYKAREYLSYVYGYLPGLLYNKLPMKYWQHFCKLVRGIKIILQRSITLPQLQKAWQLLTEFCVEFEVLYVQRKACRLHFVHQSIHNLFHLAPDTLLCGPLAPLSQWTIERAIGYLGEEVRQPSNPYKNLSYRGLRRAQVNALLAMAPDLSEPESLPSPRSAVVIADDLVLMHPKDSNKKAISMSLAEKTALSKFCERTVNARINLNSNVICHRWGRLLLPTRQIARTYWKESQKSPDQALRTSRMIKFEMSQKELLGEVMYFFEVPLNGSDHQVAMVSLCDDPDVHLMGISYDVLWVTKWTTGENLVVIDVRDIKSVVSLLPFSQQPGYHCLFEDFGLDVAYLSSHEFSLEGLHSDE